MSNNKKRANNYIDNTRFFEEMVVYKTAVRKAKQDGTQLPRIQNYIGECILLIANNLSIKSQFAGYSYKDEMISDGIENSIKYIDNFDETRFNNPFAYFTMIIWRAFLRRIWIEKKQQYIKYKTIERVALDTLMELNDNEFCTSVCGMNNDQVNRIVDEFETKMKALPVTKKTGKKGVELFIND